MNSQDSLQGRDEAPMETRHRQNGAFKNSDQHIWQIRKVSTDGNNDFMQVEEVRITSESPDQNERSNVMQ
jgi:hypothetical protein